MAPMRILIMGGTRFVGRYIAQAAIDSGHDVTLFHRGQTGDELFPQASHLRGDRNQDLSALADGHWDATVDVSAYLPRQVQALAEALDGRGGHQLLISSVSVYRTPVAPGFDESAPLIELADPATEEITGDTYGGLKVLCERAATALYGADRTTIVRPTYVIGPHDHSGRFTWWVRRLARGGTVLAPGGAADPMQLIDVRDQGSWVVALLEKSLSGTFHAVSPAPPFGFGDMLDAIAAEVAPAGTQLVWVDSDFLHAQGVAETSIPLWGGGGSDTDASAADPAAAFAAGLAPRPLRQSVADICAEQAGSGAAPPAGDRLTPEREAELLQRWASR